MAFSQKAVKEKLEEFAEVAAQIEDLETKRNKKLNPLIQKHNDELSPILEKYEKAVTPLNEKRRSLIAEIETMLKTNADAEGNPKLLTISSENATVTVTKSEGARIVSVKEFFKKVKTKGEEFYNCLKVEVGKAEKLLGKSQIDEISEKKVSFPISITRN